MKSIDEMFNEEYENCAAKDFKTFELWTSI